LGHAFGVGEAHPFFGRQTGNARRAKVIVGYVGIQFKAAEPNLGVRDAEFP
jgi:hypothetical protein